MKSLAVSGSKNDLIHVGLMAQVVGGNAILWFRKGLRLHDNLALAKALEDKPRELYPVFCLDPWFLDPEKVGAVRLRFLLQSLRDLDQNLRALNSRLFVLKGKPTELFPRYFKQWNIKRLVFEKDSEPYAKVRDFDVTKVSTELGVEVYRTAGHTLYDLDEILALCNRKPPTVYSSFNNLLKKLGPPAKPLPYPTEKLPGFTISDQENQSDHDESRWMENYSVPKLEQIKNYPTEDSLAPPVTLGGENAGIRRMNEYLKYKKRAREFKKPNTNPALILSASPTERDGETALTSPYLKFGCLSPRLFYWELQKIYAEGPHSNPPESLEGQLLWREFFYTQAYAYPNFDKIEGNPVCRKIPWDENPEFVAAWKEGRTGFPWIDAIMRQLHQQGWMHHLARHCVACFLTRGDLYQSWTEGVKVFDQLLLDADWSLNNGNWMWLSASAFFHQYWRVYSPISFGQKYDPEGNFIRKFVPELAKFPAKFIYEPWLAPIKTQKDAGCIIGQDYPKPIVDHKEISKKCIARMKAAYEGSSIIDGVATKVEDTEQDAKERPKKTVKRPAADNSTLDKFVGSAKRVKKE